MQKSQGDAKTARSQPQTMRESLYTSGTLRSYRLTTSKKKKALFGSNTNMKLSEQLLIEAKRSNKTGTQKISSSLQRPQKEHEWVRSISNNRGRAWYAYHCYYGEFEDQRIQEQNRMY